MSVHTIKKVFFSLWFLLILPIYSVQSEITTQPPTPEKQSLLPVYMFADPNGNKKVYNFTKHYNHKIKFFVRDQVSSLTIPGNILDGYINNTRETTEQELIMSSFNINDYTQEAFDEWEKEFKDLKINVQIEKVNTEEEANIVICQDDALGEREGEALSSPLMGTIAKDRIHTSWCGINNQQAAIIAFNKPERFFNSFEKVYQRVKELFQSRNDFLDFSLRAVLKHEIGHALGLSHPDANDAQAYDLTHPNHETPAVMLVGEFDESPTIPAMPSIMEPTLAQYIENLYRYVNHGREETDYRFLIPGDVGIAPYESGALATVIWQLEREETTEALERCSLNPSPSASLLYTPDQLDDIPSPASSVDNSRGRLDGDLRKKRSVNEIAILKRSPRCFGSLSDLYAGDIRQIEISKTINREKYYLQTTASKTDGYYNAKWGRSYDGANPMTMIILSNPITIKTIPEEMGTIRYVKINLQDGWDNRKNSLARGTHRGSEGGVDSDAFNATYLEDGFGNKPYNLIHYLVEITGGKSALNAESARLFIMTSPSQPWGEDPIPLRVNDETCWLNHNSQNGANIDRGIYDGQYNAQFKCGSLTIYDPRVEYAEISIAQSKLIARGLDYHLTRNREVYVIQKKFNTAGLEYISTGGALDTTRSYNAYIGMFNLKEGETYRGYCGWRTAALPKNYDNIKLNCGNKTNMEQTLKIKFSNFSSLQGNSDSQHVTVMIYEEGLNGKIWGMRGIRESDGNPLPWLGSEEQSHVFDPFVSDSWLHYWPKENGQGTLLNMDHQSALQYSAASGSAVGVNMYEHDVKMDRGYASGRDYAQPDPILISILPEENTTQ